MSLANPWVLLGGVLALVGAFFFGVYMEHGRFMGFVAQVDAIGAAASKDSARKKAAAERLRKEKDDAHQRNEKDLRAQLALLDGKLRDARARRGIVPPAPEAAGGGAPGDDGRICFDREELRRRIDASLDRFAGRFGEIVSRGATALNDFNTCAAWAKRQYQSPL